MTKNELADALISITRLTKSQALTAIDGLAKCATEAFVSGENIYIRGFGTFKQEKRKARKARNIKHGTIIDIPAHRVVKFIPCKELKEQLK
jgi:DNA-binding protein HU-beta